MPPVKAHRPVVTYLQFPNQVCFRATTMPSQPRALDTVACVNHAQPAADKAPTSVVTDNICEINSSIDLTEGVSEQLLNVLLHT